MIPRPPRSTLFPYTTLFRSAVAVAPASVESLYRQHSFGKDAAVELVFVNGHFEAELSKLGGDFRGVKVGDRKSTRLNSSHSQISYAVFCLKKKKKIY